MENFKIYTNGQYDTKANLRMKLRNKMPVIINTLDSFFVNH